MIYFGNTLKTLRIKHNLTQKQLADKLGLTKSVISAYETGLRMPSYDVLISLARIFKTSTDYLLGINYHQAADLSGLSEDEIAIITDLIKILKNK